MASGRGPEGDDDLLVSDLLADRPQLAKTVRPDQTLRISGDDLERHRQGKLRGSLIVIAGAPADVGTHLVIEGTVVIGREGEGLQLRDERTSRRHALVELRGGACLLHDLGSTNGTQLNRETIPAHDPRPLEDGDKIALGSTLIKFTLVDETEARYLRRMERLASTDALTGLTAKHRFDSLLQAAFQNARAGDAPLSLLMMDIDGLKAVNDRHGHQMGAHTISQVGGLIGEIIAGRGDGCRFGGDEFCVFLPGLALERAKLVGERVRREVERERFTLGETTVSVTISIGAAELAEEQQTGEELLARADEALYRAKAAGRNNVSE